MILRNTMKLSKLTISLSLLLPILVTAYPSSAQHVQISKPKSTTQKLNSPTINYSASLDKFNITNAISPIRQGLVGQVLFKFDSFDIPNNSLNIEEKKIPTLEDYQSSCEDLANKLIQKSEDNFYVKHNIITVNQKEMSKNTKLISNVNAVSYKEWGLTFKGCVFSLRDDVILNSKDASDWSLTNIELEPLAKVNNDVPGYATIHLTTNPLRTVLNDYKINVHDQTTLQEMDLDHLDHGRPGLQNFGIQLETYEDIKENVKDYTFLPHVNNVSGQYFDLNEMELKNITNQTQLHFEASKLDSKHFQLVESHMMQNIFKDLDYNLTDIRPNPADQQVDYNNFKGIIISYRTATQDDPKIEPKRVEIYSTW